MKDWGVGVARFVATVGNQGVKMNKKPQVVLESLDDEKDPGVQMLNGSKPVLAFGRVPEGLHDAVGKACTNASEKRAVVAQSRGQRTEEAQDPLSIGGLREAFVDQQGRCFNHPASGTRRTKSSTFAGEGNANLRLTAFTGEDEKALLKVAAMEERLQLALDKSGKAGAAFALDPF